MHKKIIITGNHHTPAIELIQQLKADSIHHWSINYITDNYSGDYHIKNSLKPLLNQHLYQITGGKFYRYSILKTLKNLPQILLAIYKSLKILKKIKPDIVVSFGGYISVPVIVASTLLKIPSITHEQTTTISLSTKINSFFCRRVCLSFDNQTPAYIKNKVIVTGNLLRRQIFSTTTKTYQHLQKIIKSKPLIFVSGGNQSSSTINLTFLKIKDKLINDFTIVHHTGKSDLAMVRNKVKNHKNYYSTAFVGADDIGWILNNSQIIVNRSGANYCQEIATLKRNSILIPLSFSQQDEQLKNALWLKRKLPNNTIIINQNNLNPDNLLQAIKKLSIQKLANPPVKHQTNTKLLSVIHQYV